MDQVAVLAHERQRRLISVTDTARARSLRVWRQVDFNNLDASWRTVGPQVAAQVSNAQMELARTADSFTSKVSRSYSFPQQAAAVVPAAFAGVDGDGRDVAGILRGAVTTTKTAVGAGLGSPQALEAGANYLAAIVKTVIADLARSADLVAATGKGYTYYVRVVGGSACSRCAILSGIRSGETAFQRHLSCQCTAVAVDSRGPLRAPDGLHSSPDEHFAALSEAEQDRIFTKAGADAIRAGADPVKVVNARRGANGVGYSSRSGARTPGAPQGRFVKTTIGYRPGGAPVQVYTTSEGVTVRGQFGRTQRDMGTSRVRLMPESIMAIAGDDLALRQAFLRDAGYLDYVPAHGYGPGWIAEVAQLRRADRILVDRATRKYGNFYLS